MVLDSANTQADDTPHSADDTAHSKGAERLRDRFLTPVEVHDLKWPWYNIWNSGEFPPWDKGIASPPLVDLIVNRADHPFFLPHDNKPTPKTALVPACGRGYDVLLLAKHGYHAIGVDSSKRAIADAREYVDLEIQKLKDAGQPGLTGKVDFFVGDFFKDDWVESLGLSITGGFDIIYDYTFLVTLDPEHRTETAARMAQLISQGDGLLIALEFPLFRPYEAGRPYHAITNETYDYLFSNKFQKLLHYSPEKTHKAGQGFDMVSVWRRYKDSKPKEIGDTEETEEIGDTEEIEDIGEVVEIEDIGETWEIEEIEEIGEAEERQAIDDIEA